MARPRKTPRTAKKEPEGIASIIAALKAGSALTKSFDEARLWERWPEVAGPHLMPHGRPLGVRDNTLIIEVASAAWMHRFAYFRWDILKQVNRLAGRELASDIFLTLAPDEKLEPPQQGV